MVVKRELGWATISCGAGAGTAGGAAAVVSANAGVGVLTLGAVCAPLATCDPPALDVGAGAAASLPAAGAAVAAGGAALAAPCARCTVTVCRGVSCCATTRSGNRATS